LIQSIDWVVVPNYSLSSYLIDAVRIVLLNDASHSTHTTRFHLIGMVGIYSNRKINGLLSSNWKAYWNIHQHTFCILRQQPYSASHIMCWFVHFNLVLFTQWKGTTSCDHRMSYASSDEACVHDTTNSETEMPYYTYSVDCW
jgi:hypothetical protein